MRLAQVVLVALAVVAVAAACSPSATPTPEPTATPVPTDTAAPTDTPVPTDTPEPSSTPTDTSIPEPTATETPRPKPLGVGWQDLHYECSKICEDGEWGYRRFQLLMVVENVSSDLTLAGGQALSEGWRPTRWSIVGDAGERTQSRTGQWILTVNSSDQDPWRRPDVPPGGRSEWTFMTQPLHYGEWVKAVEYEDEWGNLYRQEFAKPEGGEFNYDACGDPKEGSC